MANNIQIPFVLTPGPAGPGSLVALSPDATPATSPVQAAASQVVPCDVRTGPIQVNAPTNPTEGQLFAVADVYGQSSVNPISIVAQGIGVTIADPSWSGVGALYVVTAGIRGSVGTQTWRYSAVAQQWRFA